MTIRVKLGKRNQITIPSDARASLGLRPGDSMLIDIRDDSILLMKEPDNFVQHMRGLHRSVWENTDAQEHIDRERDAWKK